MCAKLREQGVVSETAALSVVGVSRRLSLPTSRGRISCLCPSQPSARLSCGQDILSSAVPLARSVLQVAMGTCVPGGKGESSLG